MLSIISHLLCAWFAFLLPSFSTYKALARLPQSEPEVQRWGMYWSVVGTYVAVEYLAGWIISWFPFYWELKTLFLLYLALPQTQGSTYIFQNFFRPWLAKNEAALDEGIESLQKNAFGFVQAKLTELVNLILKSLNKQGAAAPAGAQGQGAAAQNPLGAVSNLWNTYGGALMGALNAQSSAVTKASGVNHSANTATPRNPGASSYPTPANEITPPTFPVPQHQS